MVLGEIASRLPAEAHLPLVTVIVTAFNYERFVGQALSSVAAQSYTCFECVVVDDCSTDGTRREIERFLTGQKDPRFRLVCNEVNQGQLASQIVGVRAAHGAFIVFLDADDILFPDCLEVHVKVHLHCDPIPAMTCLDSATIGERGEVLSAHHREIRPHLAKWRRPLALGRSIDGVGECRVVPPSIANTIVLLDQYFWTTQSFMMFRTDFLGMILPDQTDRFRICSDYYLVRMAHAFNSTVLVKYCGGAYRIHGGNGFTSPVLVSADQESGDITKFAWQAGELRAVAAAVLAERFDRFAAVFGHFHVVRALIGLPRGIRPRVFRLLRRRLSFGQAAIHFATAWASHFVASRRASWRRLMRIVWAGS